MKKNAFGMEPVDDRYQLPIEKTRSEVMIGRKKLLNDNAEDLMRKMIQIALDDEHPGQGSMLGKLADRLIPISYFEKDGGVRTAIQISITGINETQIETKTIDNE